MKRDDMKALLAPLREAYRTEVRSIAERLALRFQAGKFDNATVAEEHACEPWFALETLCEDLPICRDNESARIIIAVSKYAAEAPIDQVNIEAPPVQETLWQGFASWCLARDVHDEAIRREWAPSRQERECPNYQERAARS